MLLALLAPGSALAADGAGAYAGHCASCHGAERLGGMGPALLPGNLKRLERGEAAKVIREGRPASQMPGFGAMLSDAQVDALVGLIYTPPDHTPRWTAEHIGASHRIMGGPGEPVPAPVHDADPLNLFVVVELGDHHATILDGDRFEPIHRMKTHFALHGGPKFSPDGRFVYFASRDGWISKFDLWGLQYVAEVRAGINTRNLAVSADGRVVAVANYLPHTLVLLDARDLSLRQVIPVTDGAGRSSRVSAVYGAPPRHSFVAALKDIPEIWELPVTRGGGSVTPRRIVLDDYLDDFFFDPGYRHVIGAARNARNGQVVDLERGAKVADLALDGLPHLGSGITWVRDGKRVMATPHLRKGEVTVIDTDTWETVSIIETQGPGFFMRSHENSPYAWVDVFFGPRRDVVHVIDKESLGIVKTLRPAPGKTAAHVEFDRDGRHALLSIWDPDGAVVVYNARTLEEVKRLPMNKPSGKYNVYNKITLSEGTSH